MALVYDLDRKVSLNTDTKRKLYEWSLVETDDGGNQVESDLIPYEWTVEFYSTSIEVEWRVSPIGNKQGSKASFIRARLITGSEDSDRWASPRIGMLGSSREIENIVLRIERKENVADETCIVWGSVAFEYEGADFLTESTEDTLQITFHLGGEKFDELFEMVRRKEVDRLSVSLNNVQGFYSRWSPTTITNSIKVLEKPEHQGLEVTEEWAKKIPTLGQVGSSSLMVSRTINTQKGEAVKALTDARLQSKENRPHDFYQRSLSRITKLLGLLIVIEIFRIFR